MLDDRNTGGKQNCVRRTLGVLHVVDIGAVDPNQRRARLKQDASFTSPGHDRLTGHEAMGRLYVTGSPAHPAIIAATPNRGTKPAEAD